MAKQITFPGTKEGKAAAKEYAGIMKGRGWQTLVSRNPETEVWTVHVSEIKEGKRIAHEKIPESIAEIMEQEEAEIPTGRARAIIREQKVRVGRGARRVGGEIVRAPDKLISEPLIDRKLTPAMEQARGRRSFDVVKGMRKSIPRAAPGAKTVFGADSEKPPAISEFGRARIAHQPDSPIAASGEMPLIAGTGLGVPKDVGFQAGAPSGMRFQTPKMRKLRVGHEAMPEEEDGE